MSAALGLTIYGCEPDETVAFEELSPRYGVAPRTTSAPVSETNFAAVPHHRCISVGHKSELPAPVLRALRGAGVEHISTRSIGLDHIDLTAAGQLGIAVENVRYAPDGVADFTVMLILMLIRDAQDTVRAANGSDFRLRSVRGRELRDLTIGVVGIGNIGTAVIRRLHGFGCRVLAFDPRGHAATAVDRVPLPDLLRESDVVTLHLPLFPETRHLIGHREIATMKRGAFLVNTGRGALVDTDALVVALEDGTLGGAALDVLEGEEGLFYVDCTNRRVDHRHLSRLQRLPNAIITPHTAYYTGRALRDTVEQTLVKCVDFERSRATS